MFFKKYFTIVVVLTSIYLFYGFTSPPAQNPPTAQVCFVLNVDSDCLSANYNAVLKINKIKSEVITNWDGSKVTKRYIAETKQSNIVNNQEKFVRGLKIKCLGSNYEVKTSWRDLFFYKYKRYPTTQELNSMIVDSAITWFRGMHVTRSWRCFPLGEQYPDIYATSEYHNFTSTSLLCFDWEDPVTNAEGYSLNNQLPFNIEIEFPNGKCGVERVFASSVVKPKPGEKRIINLKIKKPCAFCYVP
jgi:hypothetical protein